MEDREIKKLAKIIAGHITQNSAEWIRPKQVEMRYNLKLGALTALIKAHPKIRRMKTGTSHSSALLIHSGDLEGVMEAIAGETVDK